MVTIKFFFFQEIDPESFVTNPIIFGDFIKPGAEKADRIYEELSDLKKLKSVLSDVCIITSELEITI